MDPVTQGIRRGAFVFGFLKAWKANFKARREQRKGKQMLKGKLTYGALAISAMIFAGQAIGIEITEEQAANIVGVVVALIGAYGRYRATKPAE